MSGTLDTLQIVFTAEAGPLTSQLEQITRQLGNVNVASETAQTGLRGLAGAMQGSFSALSDRAYTAGAAAGRALANGLRSQSGAVISAAEHLAQGASAALRKVSSGGGSGSGGSSRGRGGGSGTVTISRPIQRGCMEVYNDYNGNLTNLFCCVKNRTMALLAELGFLPLNTRDDFNVLYKFFSKDEITDDYLQEEMDLTEVYLKPPDAEAIRTLMLERAPRGDIRRAADYFKLVRYSFSGGAKSFGGKPCDIRRFFHLIWECSRRLANVVIENKDFEELIRQYDRKNAVLYCDPPYYMAEGCYPVEFPLEDHQRLHDVLIGSEGYFIVSYNYQEYICDLYQDGCFIFRTSRPNSMSQRAGSEYEEIIITNYDPRKACWQLSLENLLGGDGDTRYEMIHEPKCPLKC